MFKNLGFIIVRAIFFLISILPFPLIYILSDILCFVLSNLIQYRKKTILDNLRFSFPEKTKQERDQIKEDFYKHLADLIMESIKMYTISQKELKKHFLAPQDIPNLPEKNKEALNLIQNSPGCIGMLGHYGNWEWASFTSSINFPKKENWVIYKTLQNKKFDSLMNQIRSRFGAHMIEIKTVPRKFVSSGKTPFLAYFVSDQSPQNLPFHHKTQFLNQETLVYLGAEKIAHSKNIPIVYIEIKKIKRGVYCSAVEILCEDPKNFKPEEINNLFIKRLEKSIVETPAYWLWSHKRWKYTRKE